MKLHSSYPVISLNALAALFVSAGFGQASAEVRRFMFHIDNFYAEAMNGNVHFSMPLRIPSVSPSLSFF
jgi:hypothetical protein